MLRFLSSLFANPSGEPNGADAALVEKAIERVVEGTDSRIRAVKGYQRQLRDPVVQAISHVVSLVDAFPPPIAISPQAFGEEPLLRAFFVSTEHIRKVLGGFSSLRDYLKESVIIPPDEIFGLLTMTKEERNVFGMEIEGDNLRRDVMQVSVNFRNHHFIGPTDNEADTRRELKIRAFDFLVGKALAQLTDERGKRLELDRQRFLLGQKLDAMKAGQWGLDAMLEDGETHHPSLAQLEEKINLIELELGQFRTEQLGLEESLALIGNTLGQPTDWLDSRKVSLCLDYRGIKLEGSAVSRGNAIILNELYSRSGGERTVLFGRIARTDIPEPADIWNVAKHYL